MLKVLEYTLLNRQRELLALLSNVGSITVVNIFEILEMYLDKIWEILAECAFSFTVSLNTDGVHFGRNLQRSTLIRFACRNHYPVDRSVVVLAPITFENCRWHQTFPLFIAYSR
tara:strand:+ start:172740 stop:173081 length:342 start_codon:yes stop_codon:yes gene_type:complete